MPVSKIEPRRERFALPPFGDSLQHVSRGQAEDGLHIGGLDFHKAAEGEATWFLRPVGHHVRDVLGLGPQLLKGDGHPQGVE